ncbi:NAD(P)-binding protein [Mycena sanguinolenta]|uniref:NAD(P)-binding protein n=1 Tax=Mycena sanguinolenta TaxID=230812 RepID=A0A8H7DJN3_9AGAR|nr:NAD(P)-binding protein [Mycena sanguinolenta]
MKLSVWTWLKGQFNKLPPVANADLTGKTVVVVGANTGLGFEAVKHFSKMNPERIILACRSQQKGQAAVEKIKAETGYNNAELWIVDLADFSSVKSFADKFEKNGGRLDILVENAGVATPRYEATKDGWETSLQVNSIATPLLALLLLPRMIQTARDHGTESRIVVVTSELHHWGGIPKKVLAQDDILTTLGSVEYCTPSRMRTFYNVTKLMNILFVRALNNRIDASTPLIANTVNPGLCVSELRRDIPFPLSWISRVFEWITAFTTEEGSRQLVFGAVGSGKLRGEYINQSHVEEPSDFVIGGEGKKAEDRVWDELVDILGKVDRRVLTTVDAYLISSQ